MKLTAVTILLCTVILVLVLAILNAAVAVPLFHILDKLKING